MARLPKSVNIKITKIQHYMLKNYHKQHNKHLLLNISLSQYIYIVLQNYVLVNFHLNNFRSDWIRLSNNCSCIFLTCNGKNNFLIGYVTKKGYFFTNLYVKLHIL